MHRSLAAPSPMPGTRAGRGSASTRPHAPPAAPPVSAARRGSSPGGRRAGGADDERDEYITNLKGQIYLLTIENEMLKQQDGDAKESGSQAAVYANAVVKQEAEAERAAAAAVPRPPDELADLEAHMRNKYAELERKYQQEVADAKRAAEALSTQCAAQSSLVAALRQELASTNEILAQQKTLLAQTEAVLTADLQRARADIASLHDSVATTQAAVAAEQRSVEARDVTISDLRSALSTAQAARDAAQSARLRTLDSYARIFTAMRILLKNWRHERLQRLTADAALQSARNAQEAAEKRAQLAEADAAMARAAQADAVAARNDALAQEQWLRSRCEVAELAVQRVQADAEARSASLDDLQATLTAVVRRAEFAESANVSLTSERDAALRRAGALERDLTRSQTVCSDLRSTTGAAQVSQSEADTRARQIGEALAEAQGRLAALQHTVSEDASRISGLEASVSSERDARIAAETEVARLQEELSRRPPIDVLRQLDIDSLLHRNLEAAAAMQSLLAIAQAAKASPTFSRTQTRAAAASGVEHDEQKAGL